MSGPASALHTATTAYAGPMRAPAAVPAHETLFEIPVGDSSPVSLGKAVVEEKIESTGEYYFPSAFSVFSGLDLVAVLDPARKRVARYDMKGNYLGEVKLPFDGRPLDFAWFPLCRTAFFTFSEKPELGIMDIDLDTPSTKIISRAINLPSICGAPDSKDFDVSGIWPASLFDSKECVIVLNTPSDLRQNMAFSWASGELKPFPGPSADAIRPAALGSPLRAAFDYRFNETGAVIVIEELGFPERSSSFILPTELRIGKGSECRQVRPTGSDSTGSVYLEARFGPDDGNITSAYIYKFTRAGAAAGRAAIPVSPDMRTARCISIDPDGGIYYMKRNSISNKIQFCKIDL